MVAISCLLLLLLLSFPSSSFGLTVPPRKAQSMISKVIIQSGVSLKPSNLQTSSQQQKTTDWFQTVFARLNYYPRDSLLQSIIKVNMTGPMSITQKHSGYVFDDTNSLELEWHATIQNPEDMYFYNNNDEEEHKRKMNDLDVITMEEARTDDSGQGEDGARSSTYYEYIPKSEQQDVVKEEIFAADCTIDIIAEVETTNTPIPICHQIPFPPDVSSYLTDNLQLEQQKQKEFVNPRFYLQEATIADRSPKIQRLAESLTVDQNINDWYKAVFALANWVTTYIDNHHWWHSQQEKQPNPQPASQVLENMYGKCNEEITALFVSLNRAVGIPARFVFGHSYQKNPISKKRKEEEDEENDGDDDERRTTTTNKLKETSKDNSDNDADEDWSPHTWAEVWFPTIGWVPFDVIANSKNNNGNGGGEYGYLNCGNIMLGVSHDAPNHLEAMKHTLFIEYSSYGKDYQLVTRPICTQVIPCSTTASSASSSKMPGTTMKSNKESSNKLQVSLDTPSSSQSSRQARNHRYNNKNNNDNNMVHFGSPITLMATIENHYDHYIITRFEVATHENVTLVVDTNDKEHDYDDDDDFIEEGQQQEHHYHQSNFLMLLGPQEVRTVPLKFLVNPDLKRNGQRYELPIEISAKLYDHDDNDNDTMIAKDDTKLIVEEKSKKGRNAVAASSHYNYYKSKRDYQIRVDGPVSIRPTFDDYF